MPDREPLAELDRPYSSDGVGATTWADASAHLEGAGVYWLSTVRPDGRPHATPVAGAWLTGAMFFPTGPAERKAKNLEHNAHCLVTTGCNDFRSGVDVIVEGDAERTTNEAKLRAVAETFATKYAGYFGFIVRNGVLTNPEGDEVYVFEVRPAAAFAYGRSGDQFSATRYRF